MASTAQKEYPGRMYKSVAPTNESIAPTFAAVSRERTAVVPTATTLPLILLVCLIAATVSSETAHHSECIACSSICFVLMGRNVSIPTCKVTSARFTPLLFSSRKSEGVKCRPAVGAAADPGRSAKTVWYLSISSVRATPSRIYPGRGTRPTRDRKSSVGSSEHGSTNQVPPESRPTSSRTA